MPVYAVDDPDNPQPSQHPTITLVDPDGGSYNPDGLDIPFNVDPRLISSTGASMNANQAYYYRVTRGMAVITAIAVSINVQGGNVSAAVYRNTGKGKAARPGVRVATSGSVACGAAGRQELVLDVPVSVSPGDWFAVAADNATIRMDALVPNSNLNFDGMAAWQATAFPPPNPAVPVNSNLGRTFPLVGVPQ